MRLFGIMVVRNAADLLAINLRHHLTQGVEHFLVCDHASSDATPDLLSDFAARGIVEWRRVEDGPFRCEQWMNELALEAVLQGADWILPIDSDELWTASPGATIADELRGTDSAALEVEVLNFVQQHDQLASEPAALSRMRYRVDRPRLARPERFGSPVAEELWPFVATAYPTKFISRANPRLRLHRGSHGVDGIAGAMAPAVDIVCLHAPLRSRSALAARLQDSPPVDPLLKPHDSWHALEWRRRGNSPEAVDAEWRRNSAEGDHLVASGLPLVEDDRLAAAVRPWLDGGAAPPAKGQPRSATRTAAVGEQLREALAAERERRLEATQRAARAESELSEARAELAELRESDRRDREDRIEMLEAENAVWRDVRSSRFFRFWMTSIRIRRALGLVRFSNGGSAPRAAEPKDAAVTVAGRGYTDPIRIFSPGECARLIDLLRAESPGTREWAKDGAVASRLLYELAVHPAIVAVVERCLGGDVVLWGAGLAIRPPAAVHPWHTDIETSSPEDGTLSVWVGLENVSAESSLHVVPGSHGFGRTLQQRAAEAGLRRGEASESDIAGWARELDATSGVRVASMSDGEAIFFDGRLWHGTANRGERTRTALLLQYARASRSMRIPDFSRLEWPFRWLDEPLPACLRILGDGGSANRLAQPPPRASAQGETRLAIAARAVDTTALPEAASGWTPYPLFRGASPNLAAIACHYSALAPGICPHPPHVHEEEELLLPISGPLEIVEVDAAGLTTSRIARRGELAFFPSWHRHTVRNSAEGDAIYLMFKWTGRPAEPRGSVPAGIRSFAERFAGSPREDEGGFAPRLLFEGPTRHLAKLHAHVTTLAPGGGYPPHRDDHDLAFLVLDGVLEACGEQVKANGVLFIPAGELHGAFNPGEAPVHYVVFEFHGRDPHAVDRTGFEYFELPAG